MKDPEIQDLANKLANEVDRRIRKGEIEFAWMEEHFYQVLLGASRMGSAAEREQWQKDRE